MPKAKSDSKAVKKSATKPAAKVVAKPAARRVPKPVAKAVAPAAPSGTRTVAKKIATKKPAFVAPSIAEARLTPPGQAPQNFARKSLRALPSSYGESHLLLLARDPQTLFAAWDMAPATTDALKAEIGARGYAVSNLTLRLTRAGGKTSTFELGKRVRSRYLRVDGGSSYIAEIGLTTPAGRFQLLARSAPCTVPRGSEVLAETTDPRSRIVIGFREALTLARRGRGVLKAAGASRASAQPSSNALLSVPAPGRPPAAVVGAAAAAASAAGEDRPTSGVMGGASDLYRR